MNRRYGTDRPKSKTPYTIQYLLSKQPKSLEKHSQYPAMLHYYHLSPRLKTVRFSRRCYSLLQHAKIAPENLKYFYRTYRLPKDPFFPLYFTIKRDYLKQKAQRKQEKIQYIASQMRALSPSVLGFIKFLAAYEQGLNYSGRHPVWDEQLFPKTKKRVREYAHYRYDDWIQFFRAYLQALEKRYRTPDSRTAEILLAGLVLECLPGVLPRSPDLSRPSPADVMKQFRKLSKLHHPDRGGKAERFVHLKWARDVLLKRDRHRG
jgi:hypothetical protein